MKNFKTYFILLLFLLLVGCNGLFPSIDSPPEILTRDAKNIEEKCAVLSGEIINDGGGCLEVGFEYYKGNEPENTFSISEEGSFSCGVFDICLDDGSLESDINYHFRAYAKNADDFGYGEWLSFTTLKESQILPPISPSSSFDIEKVIKDTEELSNLAEQKVIEIMQSPPPDIDGVIQILSEYLDEQPYVESCEIFGNIIEITFDTGVLMEILLTNMDEGEPPAGTSSSQLSENINLSSFRNREKEHDQIPIESQTIVGEGLFDNYVSRDADHYLEPKDASNIEYMVNRKVFVYDPFYTYRLHWNYDVGTTYKELLDNSGIEYDIDNSIYRDDEADIEILKTISDYGIVIIHTHGSGEWIVTGLEATENTKRMYESEMDKQYVYNFKHIEVSWKWFGLVEVYEDRLGVARWWFNFTNFPEKLPNSIIFMNTCHNGNEEFYNDFKSIGAATYYGHDNLAWTDKEIEWTSEVLEGLIDGKTTGEAYVERSNNWTWDDKNGITFWKKFGDDNICIIPPLETFTITASEGSNGSINPSGDITVNKGDDQSFTITSNENYQIADVLVDGSSVGAVSSYTFNNVTENHTISATFIEEIINHAPVINSIPITTATQDETYSYDVNAVDSDEDDLTYSLTTKPSEMIINSSTGLITWTPSSTGDYDVTVKASDGDLFDTQEYAITVSTVIPDTFTITASAGSNGSINPSGNVTVNEGSDQTFNITPDSNYQIDDVLVDGSSVGTISSYTFSDVNGDHTISASFSESTISGPVHNLTKDTYYDTIQAALTEADVGDSIEVSGGNYDFGSLNVSGIEIILNPGNYLFGNLVLESGAKFLITSDTSLEGFKGANIIADNINIGNDCIISANETGYLPMGGPGAGESNIYCDSWRRGAAGYGGKGGSTGYIGTYGIVLINANGGDSYGNLSEPIDLGSGGQYYKGGGAIKIEVSGTLKNEGIISANGKGPLAGSSGGSIWIQANNLTGMGNISTNGGSGNWDNLVEIFQGSGAGGRISIEYNNSDFPIENLFCEGGEIINNIPEKCKEKALGENGTIIINGNQIQ